MIENIFALSVVWSAEKFTDLTRAAEKICAERIVYHESRGESELGQRLTFEVVQNRKKANRMDRWGGDSFCGILTHRWQVPETCEVVNEFSFLTEPSAILPPAEPEAWAVAGLIVEQGTEGKFKAPPQFWHATFFYNKKTSGKGEGGGVWFTNNVVLTGEEGRHSFGHEPITPEERESLSPSPPNTCYFDDPSVDSRTRLPRARPMQESDVMRAAQR